MSHVPTPGEERLAILNFRPEQKLPPPEAGADPLQSLLLELTRLCLRHEVARRPSAAELLQFVLSRRPALPRVRRRRHRLRPRPRHSWPQLAAATSLNRARAPLPPLTTERASTPCQRYPPPDDTRRNGHRTSPSPPSTAPAPLRPPFAAAGD